MYPAFLERVALSTSALQLFANRACLLDTSDNVVGGTEVQAGSQSSVKALIMSHVGSVVTVSYLNNSLGFQATGVSLRLSYGCCSSFD